MIIMNTTTLFKKKNLNLNFLILKLNEVYLILYFTTDYMMWYDMMIMNSTLILFYVFKSINLEMKFINKN